MKRKSIYMLCLITLLLCGCSSENNFAEKYMLDHSNISDESSYQQYTEISNQLNANGEYDILPEADDAIPAMGTVREKPICAVLAQNSKLNIHYYLDDSCEQEIVPPINRKGESLNYLEHYMSPGESIYARIDNFDGLYEFDRFRIIDDIENHSETPEAWWSADNSVYTITVPESFTGTDIIIEPLGVYHYRTLTLSDYIDIDGLKQNTNGKWTINDDEYSNGIAKILPDTTYIVKYEYDKNLYYTTDDDCKPTPYHINEDSGTIEFPQNNGEFTSYLVRLHPFTDINIENDKRITSICHNSEAVGISGDKIIINKVKEGDTITIDLNDPKYKVNGISNYIKGANGYRFTYTVPKATKYAKSNYSFNVEKWDKKKVSVSVEEQNAKPSLKNLFTSESAEESAIVIEISGTEDRTMLYKDIKSKKDISVYENDVIKIKVNKDVLVEGNITITTNDSASYEVNAQSTKTDFSFRYSDIDSLKIEINETL